MTIVYVEGFEHKDKITDITFPTGLGLWTSTAGGAQITFPAGRTGSCLHFVYDGASARNLSRSDVGTGAADHNTGSLYFRVASAPSVDSIFLSIQAGGFNVPRVRIMAAGTITLDIRGSSIQTGPSVSDNAWHRLDWHTDTSTTTWTVDWAVDGANQTQSSLAGQTAGSDPKTLIYGSTTTTHTLTIDIDDVVIGDAAGDYKINAGAAYNVGVLQLTGDGTHNAGTNIIEDQAGTDIVSPNAFPLMNEIPVESTDYVRQIAVGSGNYAEVTFEDTTHDSFVAVSALAYASAAQASNPNGTIRLVDSGGSTVVDLFSGNIGGGSTTTRAVMAVVAPPGGTWDTSEVNGLKLRVGFSTDATGSATPRWLLAILQYAFGADVGGGGGSVVDPLGMSGFFGA